MGAAVLGFNTMEVWIIMEWLKTLIYMLYRVINSQISPLSFGPAVMFPTQSGFRGSLLTLIHSWGHTCTQTPAQRDHMIFPIITISHLINTGYLQSQLYQMYTVPSTSMSTTWGNSYMWWEKSFLCSWLKFVSSCRYKTSVNTSPPQLLLSCSVSSKKKRHSRSSFHFSFLTF